MSIAAELEGARRAIAERLEALGFEPPRLGVVAGSGLGGFVRAVEVGASIPFDEIPGLASGSVPGHAFRWIIGRVAGAAIHVLAGRRHLYEGVSPEEAVRAVRVLALVGVRLVILTNAAGGVSRKLFPGDLMLIRDHIQLQFRNPLRGPNLEALGPRFPDLSEPYDRSAGAMLRRAARTERLALKEGVYVALTGPAYETLAEIGFLRRIGADAVGMSTVPEVLAARHAGLCVLGLSLITNSHVHRPPGGKTSHEEVLAMGREGEDRVRRLMTRALPSLEQLTGSPLYAGARAAHEKGEP